MMATPMRSSRGASVVHADSLAAGVMRADSAIQGLRDFASLRRAASALIGAATSTGCYNLVAANAAAEPLATAAVLISDGKLTCTDMRHSTADRVLIVDTATVSGNVTRECASYLRANGATWVGAIIYDRVRPDLDGLDDEPAIDHVETLLSH